MPIDPRVICSTITLRHLPLDDALSTIAAGGFEEIDLGALPGVCDHVPYDLNDQAVQDVATTVAASGLKVRSVNGDIGDLNKVLPPSGREAQRTHACRLFELTKAIGGQALVLPNGRQSHEPFDTIESDLDLVAHRLNGLAMDAADYGVQLWLEAPHWFRLAYNLERTEKLLKRLNPCIGVVCDVSHITASGSTPRAFLDLFAERTRHVHIRDAEAGYIHHSVGNGEVDFSDLVACLTEYGYAGALALELETRDVEDADRADEAIRAAEYLSGLLTLPERAAARR